MSYTPSQDLRMFTSPDYRSDGMSIVIIDDLAAMATKEHPTRDDAIFIAKLVEQLELSAVVKRTILTDFEFALDWIPHDELKGCLFLVDVFGGEDKQPRGVEIVAKLRTLVSADQVIIFSRAQVPERAKLFGPEHGYDAILKGIDEDEKGFAVDELWPTLLGKAISLIEKKCKDPYLESVGVWNRIDSELNAWRGRGVLFPEYKHGIGWWIDHGHESDVADDLEHGRKLFAELVRQRIELSHIAVFCGLKAIWAGRASARLFCEVAGIAQDSITRQKIQRQLLSPAAVGVDAQALAGMRKLFSDSPGGAWNCDVEPITETELVIHGEVELATELAATEAAALLSKTPEARMKDDPRRAGRPGVGVTAAHKIRARATSLVFSNAGKLVKLRATFALLGELSEK